MGMEVALGKCGHIDLEGGLVAVDQFGLSCGWWWHSVGGKWRKKNNNNNNNNIKKSTIYSKLTLLDNRQECILFTIVG